MPVQNANLIHRSRLSLMDRGALFVTEKVGTLGFFLIIFSWSVGWLIWNTLGPVNLRFDPFPAFVLWIFISNLIQIHLMPLIMVGQNIQGRHADVRAEQEYHTTLRAEQQIAAILKHLENHEQMILRILKRLET